MAVSGDGEEDFGCFEVVIVIYLFYFFFHMRDVISGDYIHT